MSRWLYPIIGVVFFFLPVGPAGHRWRLPSSNPAPAASALVIALAGLAITLQALPQAL